MAQIQYHLIIPPATDDEVSIFQGFNKSLFSDNFEKLLLTLCCAPNDTAELFMSQDELISYRLDSPNKSAASIGIDAAELYLPHVDHPLNIFFCLPEQIEKVVNITKKLTYPPIIISTKSHRGIVNIGNTKELNCHILDKVILAKISSLSKGKLSVDKLAKLKLRKKYNKVHSTKSKQSNITLPNDIIAMSLGYSIAPGPPMDPANTQNYYDAIVASAEAVLSILDPSAKGKNNILLFAPSIYGTLYDFNKNSWNQILRNIKVKWHRGFIKDGFFRNKHYSGIIIDTIHANNIKNENPYKDPLVSSIINERRRELRLTALAISCLSTLELKAAIRLPNSINLHQSQLKDIEAAFQKDDARSLIIAQSKFREFSNSIKNEIGQELITLITTKSDSCTICCDSPIEWTYFGQLPLMISHEVSKLPMTPGNILLQHSTPGIGKIISRQSLQQVLVLRSFHPNDPIKSLLEITINQFTFSERIDFIIKDVSCIEDVILELNNFPHSILVFDCHGDHDGIEGYGWLNIGDEKLNTWELAFKARIPPIVFLSACSTSSVNGSHVSVANGLIRSGAISVIGTYLPINAFNSAAFISRIMLRIDVLLPVIEKQGITKVSWADFIGAFYKMSYSTDILQFFLKRNTLTPQQYQGIHLTANLEINTYRSDWYDNLIMSVGKICECSKEKVLEIIMNETPLVETMLYCQIGRSDLIIIDVTDNS